MTLVIIPLIGLTKRYKKAFAGEWINKIMNYSNLAKADGLICQKVQEPQNEMKNTFFTFVT